MAYRINLTPRAQRDLDEIVGYIARDSVTAAFKWHDEALERIRSLQHNPDRCRLAPEDMPLQLGIRQLVHGNYRILFTASTERETVEILHVRHGARLWGFD